MYITMLFEVVVVVVFVVVVRLSIDVLFFIFFVKVSAPQMCTDLNFFSLS